MDGDGLKAWVQACVEAGQAAWPSLKLDPDVLARFLVERAAAEAPPALDRAADLYLACACAEGVHGAVEALERTHGEVVRRVLARLDPAQRFVDDALQILRERLFVGSAEVRPKIKDYAGRA